MLKCFQGEKTMNLLHLKYIVEVANAGSISKAANNLFMNQPHLFLNELQRVSL